MSYKVSVSETIIFPVTTNVFACPYDQNWFLRKKLKFMCWLGPALGPRSARAAKIRVRTGPGHGLGGTWNKLKTSQTLSFHVPNTSETFRKNFFSSHFESGLGPARASPGPNQALSSRPGPSEGPTRARANTWILTFSSKINFGHMNMQKRLLWPEICQFHSQKPYRTCRIVIFNFQRKSESSLLFISMATMWKWNSYFFA